MTAPELLTAAEAAALLGVRPATLRQWVRRGKLAPARVLTPRLHLYRRADVLRAKERKEARR